MITSYYGYIPPQTGNPTHDLEHVPEIQRMINETINNIVPLMINEEVKKTMRAIIPSMIDALRVDITTIVSIAFEQGAEIWKDSRTQTYISNEILKRVEARLNDIALTIDF